MISDLSPYDIGSSRLISFHAQQQYVEMTLNHYMQSLKSSSDALDYVVCKRGVSENVAESYQLGFVDRSLGKALPDTECFEGAMIRGTLQRFGLIKPNGREYFRGCVVVPVRDESGNFVDMYGRKIAKYQRGGVAFYLRIHPYAMSLFNAQALLTNNEVIICSSPIEALSFLSCGVSNVVGMMGVQSVCNAYVEQLQNNGVMSVILAINNTAQGLRYKSILIRMLKSVGINYRELELPSGKDVNNVLVESRNLHSLRKQLQSEVPFGKLCH
ncbi:toprim domain-containing protein [Aliiglaciecola sp. LCG003]|uniref:toprim domain-containing protein n=1 Tax=Aliiglaciecola sp. LCG003 TaxID=3053655 RepID=UPI0025722290|nr:toprim domain-containing protein [Aliiglaciecola sp. LCG003]WJG07953.1 toprim domain-containing protein [Aliiglaciecola sp. LCG003]